MFPVLLPAIEQMLIAAKENKVFEVCLISINKCLCIIFYQVSLEKFQKEKEGVKKSQGADL